jgi:hypothetical protein
MEMREADRLIRDVEAKEAASASASAKASASINRGSSQREGAKIPAFVIIRESCYVSVAARQLGCDPVRYRERTEGYGSGE